MTQQKVFNRNKNKILMFNPFWCVWQKKQNNYLSAALTGTVLFSTTILFPSATLAMLRDADSMYFRSGALPLRVKIQKINE